MGTRQTKGSLAESPGAPPADGAEDPAPAAAPASAPDQVPVTVTAAVTAAPRRRSSVRERGEMLAALLLRSGEKAARASSTSGAGANVAPYHRRVGLIHELQELLRQGRQEEADGVLRQLRQDLGMESTSLDDVLYRYASFRNLVDPITHDLIINLARYVHCPKPEGDALSTMEKLCRQLIYHLSPHSQWRRHSHMKRKPSQPCLKAILMVPPTNHTVDLSGIPMSFRDVERLVAYLQRYGEHVDILELGFADLTDDMVLQLLPVISSLPNLTTLALNGNHLTKAVLRDFTDILKDPAKFPVVTWIDLGNNVDIFSLPQAFLISLRKRSPKMGNLPTIMELGEGPLGGEETEDSLPSDEENHPVTETKSNPLINEESSTSIISLT